MPKIAYIPVKQLRTKIMVMLNRAEEIIEDYRSQGFVLTLRQLYYQFVSRGYLPNTTKSYKQLGYVLNEARLMGFIDWNMIEDRTRSTESLPHWDSPAEIISSAYHSYRIDKWANQKYRPEIWIEKEALTGVFARVCHELDISFLSCRGYTSQSEMWRSGMRLAGYIQSGQVPLILHFGDHDPSGMDMTRDIEERLQMFTGGGFEFERMALNLNQIEKYDPPPNPAKVTDSRYKEYRGMYGENSWELDALDPKVLSDLVRKRVNKCIDPKKWDARLKKEKKERNLIMDAQDYLKDKWHG